jgi:hypothetical protein
MFNIPNRPIVALKNLRINQIGRKPGDLIVDNKRSVAALFFNPPIIRITINLEPGET